MKLLFCLLLALPFSANASFLLQYGLNYSSQSDDSSSGEYEEDRTFHKGFIGASVNGRKTLFFGWNINSWTSNNKRGTAEDSYSLLEMGPRLQWFWNDDYNLYFSAEWNPYARGEREKTNVKRDISGSSYGLGVGYRFRLSRLVGFGASIQYHTLNLSEEKIGSNESDISDTITNLMPMLELTILTR